MMAVLVPAVALIETSFSTGRSPSTRVTPSSSTSPLNRSATPPLRFCVGADSTAPIRAYDADAWAITLLMKPMTMTGKIRMER